MATGCTLLEESAPSVRTVYACAAQLLATTGNAALPALKNHVVRPISAVHTILLSGDVARILRHPEQKSSQSPNTKYTFLNLRPSKFFSPKFYFFCTDWFHPEKYASFCRWNFVTRLSTSNTILGTPQEMLVFKFWPCIYRNVLKNWFYPEKYASFRRWEKLSLKSSLSWHKGVALFPQQSPKAESYSERKALVEIEIRP